MEEFVKWCFARCCTMHLCLFVMLIVKTVPTHSACPTHCQCLAQARVNCAGAGMWEFPPDLPASSKVLSLSRNYIHVLTQDHFSELVSLEELHVDRNVLSVLNDNTFLLLSRLLILDLRYNRIKVLARGAFNGLLKLTHLQLEGNWITTVDQFSFVSLPSLVHLELYDNRLRNLPPAVFHNNRVLQVLNMGLCDLERIPPTLLKGLHSLTYLNMSENHHLTDLAEGVFSDLTNLTKITLDGCGLRDIHVHTFTGLPKLHAVYLDGNNFAETLHWEVFANMPASVRYVSLTRNGLSSIHKTSLQTLSRIQQVNLGLNNWHCDCQLLNTRMAFISGRPPYLSDPGIVCDAPESVKGRDLWSVPIKTIMENCVNALVTKVHKSTVASGSEVQFDCPIARVNASQLAWYTPTPTYLSATSSDYSYGAEPVDRRYSLQANGTLFLKKVKQKDAGLYICSVRSVGGSSSWSVVHLHVADGGFGSHHSRATIYVAVVTTFAIVLVCAAIAAVIYRVRRKKAQTDAPLVTMRPKMSHGIMSLASRISRKSMPSEDTYAYAYAEVPVPTTKTSLSANAYAVQPLLKLRENLGPIPSGTGNNNLNGGSLMGTSAQRIVARSCREKTDLPKSPFIRTSRSIARCETYGYVSPNIHNGQHGQRVEAKPSLQTQELSGSTDSSSKAAILYDPNRPGSAGYLEIIG